MILVDFTSIPQDYFTGAGAILRSGATPNNAYWLTDHIITLRIHNKRHDSDAIMTAMASQITSLTIVYSTVYSRIGHRKHQSSASLAFVWGIHRWPVNSPHKGPVTRKMFPFHDVVMPKPRAYVMLQFFPKWRHSSSCKYFFPKYIVRSLFVFYLWFDISSSNLSSRAT